MQNQISNISPLAHSQSPIANGQCTESTRLPWLDFASGIMILWMIIYHAISSAWCYEVRDLWGITDASLLPEYVHAFINSEGKLEVLNPCVVFPWLHFFMPWFFYKSGQFFKKSSVEDLWKKDRKKLLKTFFIWSLVGYMFFILFGLIENSITVKGATYSVLRGLLLKGQVPINGPCWFLLTLFGVRLIANVILPKRENKYIFPILAGVVLFAYVLSFVANIYNHSLLPYWVGNGIAGFCYFSLGYALCNYDVKKWVVIPSILVVFVFGIMGFPMVNMLYNELYAGSSYLFWIPVSLCCIISFNALCRLVYEFVHIKFIEYVGRNAMTILVTHCLIYMTVSKIFHYFISDVSYVVMFGVVILSYIVLLPICCLLSNKASSR